MPLTADRFKRIFTSKVSDDLVTNRTAKIDTEITRLETAIAALIQAGIDARGFTDLAAALRSQRGKALAEKDNEAKYKALDAVKDRARLHAESAEKALLIHPPATKVAQLKTLIETSGTAALDRQIEKLGGQASKDSEKQLVIAAINARWGLEKLSGQLTTKALPRLYKVMTMVPEDHIKGNDKLKEIRRDRAPEPGETSFYRGSENLIVLNLDKTGFWHADSTTVTDDAGVSRSVSYFDHTTLHEIGHAVDEKTGWMTNKGPTGEFGEWKKMEVSELADLAGTKKGFYADFRRPQPLLRMVLEGALSSGKIDNAKRRWADAVEKSRQIGATGVTREELENDPGIIFAEEKRAELDALGWPQNDEASNAFNAVLGKVKLDRKKMLAVLSLRYSVLNERIPLARALDLLFAVSPEDKASDDEWDRMEKHAAVAWCRSIRMASGSNGLWSGGKSAAAAAAIEGYVYQQAYSSEWWRYKLGARAGGISDYQFRAPGEYFSELYAAYYLGWLPKTHWIGSIEMNPA